jgi:hypothetical protein
MIQDMFNPEIYAALLNSSNGKKINHTDSVYLDEKYFVNPNKNTIMDRYIYYMISIPGVNEWVKQCWDKEGKTENINHPFNNQTTSNQEQNAFKRSFEEEL